MPVLDRITLKGFKSIDDLSDFDLRGLNLLIGANGAGKSNFVSFFRLLRELVGGRFQHYSIQQGLASSFLHRGAAQARSIESELDFGSVLYRFTLEPRLDQRLFLSHESGSYDGGRASFDFPVSHMESRLAESLTGEPLNGFLEPVVSALTGCLVYHFNDTSETSGIKQVGQANDNRFLRSDASNLAAFLRALKITHPTRYARIRETIQLVAPFFDDFILEPLAENPELIRLEWRQKGSDYPFLPHQLSDGTLRFMALASLLLQPSPPSITILDEPELGLHPVAIELLASLLHEAALQTQVVASTQSPALISQFEPEEVVVVDRVRGASRFRRLEQDPLREWLDDYALGDLVQKNVIEAGPRYE